MEKKSESGKRIERFKETRAQLRKAFEIATDPKLTRDEKIAAFVKATTRHRKTDDSKKA